MASVRTSFTIFAHTSTLNVQFEQMEIQDSFIQLIENSIRQHWDMAALTD